MKDWFDNLEARERWMVAAGAAFVVIVVFIVGIVRPLNRGTRQAEERVQAKTQLLEDLRAAQAELRARGPGSTKTAVRSNESLYVIVDRSTRAKGLAGALKRNQPVGDSGIRVRLEDASFDQVLAWLGTLRESYGLTIVNASFNGSSQPGLVTASLVLERPVT